MNPLFSFFADDNARMMAGVVAFAAFFLIGRVAKARQPVALAFAFLPLMAFAAIESAMAGGLPI